MHIRISRRASVYALAAFLAFSTLASAQANPPRPDRVINDADTVELKGEVHPLARPEYDAGLADRSARMEHVILMLSLRPGANTELDSLIRQQHNPQSTLYHQWLTPDEFGTMFGMTDANLGTVEWWLQQHGFTVDEVARGRRWINFSGTVGQVEQAFHTEIHNYFVNGEMHQANSKAPAIPRALADLVVGFASLHDFYKKPMHTSVNAIAPNFTDSSGNHYLTPGDFATIYDVNPLYSQSPAIDGSGQTVAVVARSNINHADVTTFRSTFGLPAKTPNYIVNGNDPGLVGGPTGGEVTEADLDVQWSGAIAYNATVDMVISKSTRTTDGVDLSAQYIVNNNLAPIMTTSFGSCEQNMGSDNTFYANLWAQAASQGITPFVSSGDAGAAGCDTGGSSTGTVRAVNGLCSTPNSVCVGGTQFLDTANPSAYWSSTNNSNKSSVLSYIPEQAWNESGSVSGGSGLWATGGGASTLYTKPTWQVAPGVPSDAVRDVPDVSLSAAGHDGYLVYQNGGLYSVGGTSAASPSFASVLALVLQGKSGTRQGNANTVFYPMANNQYSGSGAPVVYHDTTSGNNTVPGVTGYNAGSGFDLSTGLGSVNVTNLVQNWGVPDFSVSSAGSATVLRASSSQVAITTSVSSGFSSSLSLSASGLPSGVTASFSPSSVSAPGSGSSTMTLTAASNAVLGTVTITVTATGEGKTHTTTLQLTVGAAPSSAVAFVSTDSATQGNWKAAYGADGFNVLGDAASYPAYAAVTPSGQASYTWAASTTDVRALSKSAASDRVAGCWFSYNSFTVDVNLTDSSTHQVSLYFLDWENAGRVVAVTVQDAATGATMDTRTVSSFYGGKYLVWNISGHVTFTITKSAGNNAVISGLFFGGPRLVSASNATFVKSDTTTQGNWQGSYGADGYNVFGDSQAYPAYATITAASQAPYTWAASTTDTRALVKSASTDRVAACWYAYASFSIDLNLTDGNSHQIALYLLDWENAHRTESVTVQDAATGTVLDTRSVSNFSAGQYLVWTLSGHVIIKVTNTAGSSTNAVLSGIFFGGARSATSASFVKTDTTLQGNWQYAYGADGYNVVGDSFSYPSYASVSASGQGAYTWSASTTDPRALTKATSSDRVAGCWYAYGSFNVDVNLLDGKAHTVAVYLLDWENSHRSETITVQDATTGTVLDTRSVTNFSGGQYLVWNLSGHVVITFTNTASGTNAVMSGIFFGGARSASATAAFLKTDSTTQGSWQGTYGADGYNVLGDTNSYPSYATVTPATQGFYNWASSTGDVRALQTSSGLTRDAACWYAYSSFTVDVNLLDGNTHQLTVYLLDWENANRAETVTVQDAISGNVLDTRSVTSFSGGQYLVWNVSGHVVLKFTNNAGTTNAVMSGLFFR